MSSPKLSTSPATYPELRYELASAVFQRAEEGAREALALMGGANAHPQDLAASSVDLPQPAHGHDLALDRADQHGAPAAQVGPGDVVQIATVDVAVLRHTGGRQPVAVQLDQRLVVGGLVVSDDQPGQVLRAAR